MVSVLACAASVMLSACTLLQSSESRSLTAGTENTSVYRGKIGAHKVDGESPYLLGCVFQERKKHHLAITEFEIAVQNDPGHAAAYNGLGVSLDALGDFDRAVAAYMAALAVDENLDYVHNNLGYSYLLQGRPDLAIESFKMAVALDGSNQQYQNNLGLAYARDEQYDAALSAFKASGDDARAHLNMGRFYFRNGLYEKANVHFAWASVLKPSDADITKARTVSAILAQIHESQRVQPEKKETTPTQDRPIQMTRYEDGFYTIPAGAIQNLKIIDIDSVDPVDDTFAATADNADQPIYTVSVTQIASPAVEQANVEESLQPFDVLKRMEEQDLETIASGKVSFSGSKIEISNGNGVNGMARTVGRYLKTRGIEDYRLTNADHFNYAGTVIYYRDGFFDQASHIKGLLPGTSNADQLVVSHLMREPIRVLIGRDLVEPFREYSPHNFKIDLSNGNGVNGMARRLAKHLIEKGFRVGRLTNADHFRYERTAVFCSQGQLTYAKLVADALPGDGDNRIIELSRPGNRVQVVLGSDMVF